MSQRSLRKEKESLSVGQQEILDGNYRVLNPGLQPSFLSMFHLTKKKTKGETERKGTQD